MVRACVIRVDDVTLMGSIGMDTKCPAMVREDHLVNPSVNG